MFEIYPDGVCAISRHRDGEAGEESPHEQSADKSDREYREYRNFFLGSIALLSSTAGIGVCQLLAFNHWYFLLIPLATLLIANAVFMFWLMLTKS